MSAEEITINVKTLNSNVYAITVPKNVKYFFNMQTLVLESRYNTYCSAFCYCTNFNFLNTSLDQCSGAEKEN